jgi:hypothetical protein
MWRIPGLPAITTTPNTTLRRQAAHRGCARTIVNGHTSNDNTYFLLLSPTRCPTTIHYLPRLLPPPILLWHVCQRTPTPASNDNMGSRRVLSRWYVFFLNLCFFTNYYLQIADYEYLQRLPPPSTNNVDWGSDGEVRERRRKQGLVTRLKPKVRFFFFSLFFLNALTTMFFSIITLGFPPTNLGHEHASVHMKKAQMIARFFLSFYIFY